MVVVSTVLGDVTELLVRGAMAAVKRSYQVVVVVIVGILVVMFNDRDIFV